MFSSHVVSKLFYIVEIFLNESPSQGGGARVIWVTLWH